MTEDQFCTWILFALPVLTCFCNESLSFQYQLILALLILLVWDLPLLIIAEKAFIKDCKIGYKDWEDSIFPQWIYKMVKK